MLLTASFFAGSGMIPDAEGVDKTWNRTRTGGLGLADADSDWRTRTRGPTKKIEKYLKKKFQ